MWPPSPKCLHSALTTSVFAPPHPHRLARRLPPLGSKARMCRRKKGRKGGQEGEREGSLFSLGPDPVAHSHCGFDFPLGKMKFEHPTHTCPRLSSARFSSPAGNMSVLRGSRRRWRTLCDQQSDQGRCRFTECPRAGEWAQRPYKGSPARAWGRQWLLPRQPWRSLE